MTITPRLGLVFLSLAGALLAAPSQAALLRGSGGAIAQDSFNDTTWLLKDVFAPTGSILEEGTVVGGYSLNSYFAGAYATPAQDCWFDVTRSEFTGPLGNRTDCNYEFEEGETLELEGYVDKFVQGSLFSFTWEIRSTDGSNRLWTFSAEGVSWVPDTYTACDQWDAFGNDCLVTKEVEKQNNRRVFLDVPMPADMGVGEYLVFLTLDMAAPEGQTFFHFNDYTDIEFGEGADCPQVDDDPVRYACGQTGTFSDTRGFRSLGDNLRVVSQVPEPGTLALFGLGAAGLALARRRRSDQRAH